MSFEDHISSPSPWIDDDTRRPNLPPDKAASAAQICRRKKLGSLFPLSSLPRLCLGASRELARSKALFNVAAAKVAPIQ